MNVLLITKCFDIRSGIGRYSKEVRDGLLSSQNNVDVLSEDEGSISPHGRYVWGLVKNCITARKLARNKEVVHALDAWPYGVYGLCAVLGTNKKFFVGGVGTYSIPPRKVSFKKILMIWLYWRAQGVFCISRYTKRRITERLPASIKAKVIHLASNPLPQPTSAALKKFGIKEISRPIFITVGAVKERKGQLDTLRGLAIIKNDYPQFLYLLVGDLSDAFYVQKIREEAIRLGIQNNILLIDAAKTDQDLADLYAISNILFLNSNNDGDHFEGFGLVFLEAAQFGLPGIGSKNTGIEDAIHDGVSGILVGQKNHQAIADAVQTIMKNKTKFVDGARDWYNEFSWKKTIDQYLEIYKG